MDDDSITTEGATLATAHNTVASETTLDVSDGTLALANDQIAPSKINLGALTEVGALAAGSIATGFGAISTAGAISTTSTGTITSAGALTASTEAILAQTTVAAGSTITVPNTHSHVKITDESATAANAVTITTSGATTGQLLFVHNADATATSSVIIPAGRTMLFLYDGAAWQEVTTSNIDGATVDSVTSLTAAANLDIGSYTLRASNFLADSQTATQVSFYGTDGVLSGDSDMTFATDTLTVTKLGAFTAAGGAVVPEPSTIALALLGGAALLLRRRK